MSEVGDQYIGKITHYFSKIGVAVIEIEEGELKVGDKIRIVGGEDTNFEQVVGSMQIEHQQVELARRGDVIGLKVDQKVREGYKVYKVE